MEDYKVEFLNENNEPEIFEYLGEVDIDKTTYIVLSPEDEETADTIVMEKEVLFDDKTKTEVESFSVIDDGDLLNAIYDKFKIKYADFYEFED